MILVGLLLRILRIDLPSEAAKLAWLRDSRDIRRCDHRGRRRHQRMTGGAADRSQEQQRRSGARHVESTPQAPRTDDPTGFALREIRVARSTGRRVFKHDVAVALRRHERSDWGEVTREAWAANDANRIALRLNQRPRKTLDFRCPADVFDEAVALTG